MRNSSGLTLAVTLSLSASLAALAQTAPDAGLTLHQNQSHVLQAPRPSPDIAVQIPAARPTEPGGVAVPLTSLSFSGSTVFSQVQLQTVLGDAVGKSFDLAGLRDLAERISAHYRANGYPFARAFLPAQSMAQGLLRIEVIEGQYGKVSTTGDAALASKAQVFLSGLKPGSVIESAALERSTLILYDLPGITAVPLIRPGQQMGTGDLEVEVQRSALLTGEAGLDNYGNRYIGQNRLRASANIDSPFVLGDQIKIGILDSELGTWLGTAEYNAPLGGSGLRGQVGYAHTYYKLGKEFASSDATGTAKVTTLGVKYPLLRSQQANAVVSATWQGKDLNDVQGAAGSQSTKASQSLPLALNFDVRDSLGGGAISYGTFTYTAGELRMDSGLSTTDADTAKSQGAFGKANFELARLQSLSSALALFGRVSAQWAEKNLDSSEKIGLGGSGGVRAYPSGEGFGDQGWLAQLELRCSARAYAPYMFYDTGDVTINAKPWSAGANQRTLSGGGLGLRYQRDGWSMDAVVAWRDQGGRPTSDTSATDPLVWLSLGYKF